MVDQGSGVGPVSSRGKEKGKVVTHMLSELDVALLPGLGNQVAGPRDYLPTERLAPTPSVEWSFWV